MLSIFDKSGNLRLQFHQDDGAQMSLVLGGDETLTTNLKSKAYIPFDVGDHLTVFGRTFKLYTKPSPLDKTSKETFQYTMTFKSLQYELDYVNFVLFDNTTNDLAPVYSPTTTYYNGDIVYYRTLYWQYINVSASAGHAPREDDYWQIKSAVTYELPDWDIATTYSYGDEVEYDSAYWRYVSSTPSAAQVPEDGEYWAMIRTAPDFEFSACLTPKRFAQLICDNMQRAQNEYNWTVGYTVAKSPTSITFSKVSCMSAATSIAEAFDETEFWVEQTGQYDLTINFGKRSHATGITFSVGKDNGLTKITRNEVTESKQITRLVALGGSTNILPSYRNGASSLMLPGKYYLDAPNIDLNKPLEGYVTFEDIYPSLSHAKEDYDAYTTYYEGDLVIYNSISWEAKTTTVGNTPAAGTYWKMSPGQITSTNNYISFYDANLGFNPLDSQYILADGTRPKVHFDTGNLAGYDFPIASYDIGTGLITLEQIQEESDSLLPTGGYTFSAGDWFHLIDLYMPQIYTTRAEQRLLAEAQSYLDDYSKPQLSYSCEIDVIKATNNATELNVGDTITLVDTDFGVNAIYRIISLTRNITYPYKYTVELSTLPYIASRLTSIENAIKKSETTLNYTGMANSQMAKVRTWQGAQEAINMAFDPNGTYFTEKIKPLIIETSRILVGTAAQQYALTGLAFSTNAETPNEILWTAGQITDNGRTWNISSGSFTATDDDTAYYCYIQCERSSTSTTAAIEFTTTQYTVDKDATYYYYLLATLGSLTDGFRQFYTSNGFTFISGDSIVTGKIESADGSAYFDLKNNTLHMGGESDNYFEWDGTAFTIKGMVLAEEAYIKKLMVDRLTTAASGKRITIDPDTNSFKLYNTAGTEIGIISFLEDDGEDGVTTFPKLELKTSYDPITGTPDIISTVHIEPTYISILQNANGHEYYMVINSLVGISFYTDGVLTAAYPSTQ